MWSIFCFPLLPNWGSLLYSFWISFWAESFWNSWVVCSSWRPPKIRRIIGHYTDKLWTIQNICNKLAIDFGVLSNDSLVSYPILFYFTNVSCVYILTLKNGSIRNLNRGTYIKSERTLGGYLIVHALFLFVCHEFIVDNHFPQKCLFLFVGLIPFRLFDLGVICSFQKSFLLDDLKVNCGRF